MANVSTFAVSAASNNSASPNGFPEGMAPSGVNDSARELMAALARWYNDTKGVLETGGSGNAYTLTTNNSHATLAAQSLLVFLADRANTGAATLNVDGLGALAIRFAGSALAANDIVADKIHVVAYNATDNAYDLINKSGASLVVSGTSATDLSDTENPFNVGTLSGAHLALDPNGVQSKSNATTAGTLELNTLGGSVNLGPAAGTGTVTVYHNGAEAARSAADGWRIDGDGSNITLDMRDGGTTYAVVSHDIGTALYLRSVEHGIPIVLQGEDASGDMQSIFSGDPDGSATIYAAGSPQIVASTSGVTVSGTLTVGGNAVLTQSWSGLTPMTVAPVGADEFLINDGGTIKTMSYNEVALPSNNDADSHTFVAGDCGTIRYYTGTGGHTWTMPSGIGQNNTYIIVINSGSGNLTLAGSTATVTSAYGLLEIPPGGTVTLIRESSTVWFAAGNLQ